MTIESTSVAISTLLSLAGLWFLLFWLYRDYCVDRFRQDMFALRDELFDAAREGVLAFNHPAYATLRTTMNGFIRFAHRLSLLHALLLLRVAVKNLEPHDSFSRQISTAVETLSPDSRQRVAKFQFRMNVLVIRYILVNSPILLATLVAPIAAWIAIKICVSQLLSALRSPLERINSAAMAEGRA